MSEEIKSVYSDLDIEELKTELHSVQIFTGFLVGLIIGVAMVVRKGNK